MADHGCPLQTWQSTAPDHGYDANHNDRCNGNGNGASNGTGNVHPTIRVLRVRTPFETAQVLRKLMAEALEHIANLERPAKDAGL